MPARTGGHTLCRNEMTRIVLGICALVGFLHSPIDLTADDDVGPTHRAKTASLHPRARGANIQQTWYRLPQSWNARGTACMYDNGPALDDDGPPASQISSPAGIWPEFYGAATDDFMMTGGSPGSDCHITTVRTLFYFFGPDAESATPMTTFQGVHVTVYFNVTPANTPSGVPTISGGQSGPYLVSRFVPATSLLNQTLVGSCIPSYQVDIPVDITVAYDVTYWLSIVPVFQGPPQSFWPFSEQNHGSAAKQGFEITGSGQTPPFWTTIGGNLGSCPAAPAPASITDLAFMLLGEETPTVTGACCNDTSANCVDGINTINCQLSDLRFSEGISCAGVSPTCGTNTPGACCLGDGVCQELNPTNCQNSGGTWQAGNCSNSPCTPINGICANAISISSGVFVFSTLGALTDGPPDSPTAPCTNIGQDIWFKYTSGCTGTVTVSLCGANNFDSALAAYQTWNCFPNLGLRVACHNDFCGDDAQISFPATANQQFLIRVGGAGAASGSGTMTVSCLAAGSGACCLPDHTCQIMTQAQCQNAAGTYSGGQPCSLLTCPPPQNDLCANAIAMSSNSVFVDTRGAMTDGPTESPPCSSLNQDIWYTYTANCDGTLSLSLCGGMTFDATMAVYDGCTCSPSLGTRLGCDDDGCGTPGGPPSLTIPVTNGQCLLIRIGGNGSATGTGTLDVTCIPTGQGACCHVDLSCELALASACLAPGDQFTPGVSCAIASCSVPPHDNCANAILLSSAGPHVFNTSGATTDGPADTPSPPCTVVNQDVWYQYTAACTGQLSASLCNVTNYNAAIVIYDGCSCSPTLGAVLGCDNDSCAVGGAAQVTVPVVMGQCYLIRVGGEGATFGLGELSLNCVPDSGNVNECAGDANNDCAVDLNDISGFVDELLGTVVSPPSGVCRVDLSNDGELDGRDIQPFVEKMIGTNTCACCRGDMNNDGVLDGRDLQGMVDAVLTPPQPCTASYRAADVNFDDIVDVLDADALVTRLLNDQTCVNP